MIKESKYRTDVMKKYFSKELLMTKEGSEGFENSTIGLVTMIMLIIMLK